MSNAMKDVPVDELVRIYRKIREAIETREEAFKEEVSALKGHLDTVSDALLSLCNEQNADSIKTKNGTISRRINQRYWTTDWESMYRFIRENDSPFLLEQRIHNGNMKQFLEENPDAFPAGLQCDRKYAITVRKPTNK
jgi:predicted secreted Zn-dependent protease